LYKIRHKNDINSGAGYYANKILWWINWLIIYF
jgi:hypothetical protein